MNYSIGAIYFMTKKAARIYMTTDRFLPLPAQTLIKTYDNIPNTIPSEMLAVKGIITIVMKLGTASVISLKSIFMIV